MVPPPIPASGVAMTSEVRATCVPQPRRTVPHHHIASRSHRNCSRVPVRVRQQFRDPRCRRASKSQRRPPSVHRGVRYLPSKPRPPSSSFPPLQPHHEKHRLLLAWNSPPAAPEPQAPSSPPPTTPPPPPPPATAAFTNFSSQDEKDELDEASQHGVFRSVGLRRPGEVSRVDLVSA